MQASTPTQYWVYGCKSWRVCWWDVPSESYRNSVGESLGDHSIQKHWAREKEEETGERGKGKELN